MSINQSSQKKEETEIGRMLSVHLSIPFDQFNFNREEPDCEVVINKKNIGIELTSIHPYQFLSRWKDQEEREEYYKEKGKNEDIKKGGTAKNVIENYIRESFTEVLLEKQLYDVVIGITLDYDLYFTKVRLKSLKPDLSNEIHEAINLVLSDEIYTSCTTSVRPPKIFIYNGSLFGEISITYYKNANWNKDSPLIRNGQYIPYIYFTLGGFRPQVPPECICEAIEEKCKKYSHYKSNHTPAFDECWLCVYLQKDEDIFTIAGSKFISTKTIGFERIILVQESNLFPRVLDLKNDSAI
jgi:hypothetical protein